MVMIRDLSIYWQGPLPEQMKVHGPSISSVADSLNLTQKELLSMTDALRRCSTDPDEIMQTLTTIVAAAPDTTMTPVQLAKYTAHCFSPPISELTTEQLIGIGA